MRYVIEGTHGSKSNAIGRYGVCDGIRIIPSNYRLLVWPGWDFSFRGRCVKGEYDLLEGWIGLYCEAAPLPFEKAPDYSNIEIDLSGCYDEDSGEPLFAIDVGESCDICDVRLRFVDRADDRYLIELSGTVAEDAFGRPMPVRLLAWATEAPDHSYLPKSDT